jgi:Virulence protein
MSNDSETPRPGGQFLVYQTQDGKLKIDVRFEGETVWLTQQQMAELFQTTKQNVSLHIHNIYDERELERMATVKESLTVQPVDTHFDQATKQSKKLPGAKKARRPKP